MNPIQKPMRRVILFLFSIVISGHVTGQCAVGLVIEGDKGWIKCGDEIFAEGPIKNKKQHGKWIVYKDLMKKEFEPDTAYYNLGFRYGKWHQNVGDSCYFDFNADRTGYSNCFSNNRPSKKTTYYFDDKKRLVSQVEYFTRRGAIIETRTEYFDHRGRKRGK